MQQKKRLIKKPRYSESDLNDPGNPGELSELERDGGKLGFHLIMLVVWGGFAALLAFFFFFITNTEAGQELEIRRVARAALRRASGTSVLKASIKSGASAILSLFRYTAGKNFVMTAKL